MSPMYVQSPESGDEICDFCSSPDVAWVFPCRDFQDEAQVGAVMFQANSSPRVSSSDMTGVFVGDWACCPACHALILRGDRERLARRSAKRVVRKYAAQNVFFSFKDLLAHIRKRQDNFWANRQGPPFPITEADRIRRGRTP